MAGLPRFPIVSRRSLMEREDESRTRTSTVGLGNTLPFGQVHSLLSLGKGGLCTD